LSCISDGRLVSCGKETKDDNGFKFIFSLNSVLTVSWSCVVGCWGGVVSWGRGGLVDLCWGGLVDLSRLIGRR
jgi:hypothetical protein